MGQDEKQTDTSNQRDLVKSLTFSNFPRKFEESVDEESIELSLGLSLNGRFGVDPRREKRILSRSSSVSEFVFADEKQSNENNVVCVGVAEGLVRTCSLPAGGEEEWRKRKEASVRRMEVKRKRLEKLRNSKSQGCVETRNFGENLNSQGKLDGGGCFPPVPSSRGSVGSIGSGSSGVCESGLTSSQGMTGCTGAGSPASVHSLPKQYEQKLVVTPTMKSADFFGAAVENPSVKLAVNNAEATEMMKNMLADMPCVSTRGFGPNGKRVEGFLYRYRKGEQVRIVCVCHGSFLSPAEFVKHAGGGDVSHPLKHIVVSPSALL